MGKGLKTKGGRIMQWIRHGANPNLFDPTGLRVVNSNFEEYDYAEAIDFDKIKRQGAKALHANVPLEGMWMGSAKGALFYNLIDDQLLPYLVAKPMRDETVAGVRETEYRRPQFDRADREFFAVQEGIPTDCELGCFGLLTGFKWSSKRGNKGKSRFDLSFVTQTAVLFGAMTGSVAQNAILSVNAVNVAGDGVFALKAGALAPLNITFTIGDTIAQTIAKLALIGITATVAGTVAAGTGETHVLTANGATGNATIYNTIVVTPGMTAAALQVAIRALGGIYLNVVVTGSTTAGALNYGLNSGGAAWTHSSSVATSLGDGATPAGSTTVGTANGEWMQVNAGSAVAIAKFRLFKTAGGGANSPDSRVRIYGSATGAFAGEEALLGTKENASNNGPGAWADNTYEEVNVATPNSYRYYRFLHVSAAGNVAYFAEIQLIGAPSAGNYSVAFPAGVGDVADLTATPGAGWMGTSTAPGNAGGTIILTVTAPISTPVTITKVSGAGWSGAVTRIGSTGDIIGSIVEPLPVTPGHVLLYRADTLAGLDLPGALVGKVQDWEYNDSKICQPQAHHTLVIDPARPDLPPTYDSYFEEETEEDSIVLTTTLDCDDSGDVPALLAMARATGGRYVSKVGYWRIVATCPIAPYLIKCEFYGSIGASIPRKFGGNVEQRTLVFDLIENRELPWALRWITRRPA